MSYILQYIDGASCMASSLPNLLIIMYLKDFIDFIEKCESCGIKYKYYEYFLEYTNFKNDLTECKYFLQET